MTDRSLFESTRDIHQSNFYDTSYLKSCSTNVNQPSVIKLPRHRHHQSRNISKHRSQLKTNKLPRSIVHTTVRPLNKTKSIKHQQSLLSVGHQNTVKCPRKLSHLISVTRIHRRHRPLSQLRLERMVTVYNYIEEPHSRIGFHRSKVSHHQDIFPDHDLRIQMKTKEVWSDRLGMTTDHHQTTNRKTKKFYLRQCIIASLITTLIVGLVIAIILVSILFKSRTKTNIGTGAVPILRWNKTGITIAGITGMPGNASNQLRTPWDVVLEYPNAFYIADRDNNRVQKYVVGSLNGSTVAGQANGAASTTASYLQNPSRVLVDSNENVYVTDSGNNRIQFWLKNAASGTTVAGLGGYGNASNQFITPYGITRDLTTDTLYIADYANHRVMGYTKGALFGNLAAGGNGNGANITQLQNPIGLYFDSFSNSLVIVNYGLNNILRWMIGASSWTLLAGYSNGTSGNTSIALWGPTDITFDPMGNMYVADRNNQRIQLYMVGATDAVTIAGVTSTIGNDSILFNRPWSVKLDGQLNLYVADANNHRIQKFFRL